MKRIFYNYRLILILALFWALSGYLIGSAIENLFETLEIASSAYPIAAVLAGGNAIIGLLLFVGVTEDPTAERIFFEGPTEEGEGDVRVGCLWFIPATLLFYGMLAWLMAILFRFILPK